MKPTIDKSVTEQPIIIPPKITINKENLTFHTLFSAKGERVLII